MTGEAFLGEVLALSTRVQAGVNLSEVMDFTECRRPTSRGHAAGGNFVCVQEIERTLGCSARVAET